MALSVEFDPLKGPFSLRQSTEAQIASMKLYKEFLVEKEFERKEVFAQLQAAFQIKAVLYPGSFVHVTPSFFFDEVVYVDTDKRAKTFFDDPDLSEFISSNRKLPNTPPIKFISADFREPLDLPDERFDLLISQYAGFISLHCKRYLKTEGLLLVNNSHGDASMASIDSDYELIGVYIKQRGKYRFKDTGLDSYFVPKRATEVTQEALLSSGRGIGYTRTASSYLFRRSQ